MVNRVSSSFPNVDHSAAFNMLVVDRSDTVMSFINSRNITTGNCIMCFMSILICSQLMSSLYRN